MCLAWRARERPPPQNRGPQNKTALIFILSAWLSRNRYCYTVKLYLLACNAVPVVLPPTSNHLGEILPRCSAAARSSCRASRGAFLRCVDVPIQVQKALIVARCAHSLLSDGTDRCVVLFPTGARLQVLCSPTHHR